MFNVILGNTVFDTYYHADSDLILAPYFWEDGHSHCMEKKIKFDMVDLQSPGLKILNFHPIDLYFNTLSIEHRNKVKNLNKNIAKISKDNAEHLVNTTDYGVRNYFVDMVDYVKSNDHGTIFCNELNEEARKNIICNE